MADIDDLLGALAAKTPPALVALESQVFQGLAQRREQAAARRGMVLAVAAAAVVGIVGSVAPSAPAQAEPLFGVPQDAPSHLLAD
ncbi:MAG: hypothetical protein Q8R81_17455 [Novosphingobium sp.]|uniref:hypothetical protein n=1 Tax=Novosphingobium sp. TaxID=1874826 RepID=UPI002737653B|nr:hypothetical protein [Novosphingobium sp.]MDP3552172.1 hypothetical protein [Novosphingobium sp.]